ncbi:hypothetical protein B566_EDAN000744, partial [Ephemera danica]
MFKGLGKMKTEYTIKLQEKAVPVAAATHRRVPHPLREKTKKKLEQLVELDVISKVTEPTPWCEYLPGDKMYIPDLLSRSPSPTKDETWLHEENSANEAYVGNVIQELRIKTTKIEEIRKAQKEDITCCQLLAFASTGFPASKDQLSQEVREFWPIRNELNKAEDLLMFRSRLVIPKILRKEILACLHEGHMGVVKTKLHARATVYWPGLSRDIEHIIQKCQICTCNNPIRKEPMILRKSATQPWHRICMDIAEYEGKYYLVMVDTYSRYIEVKKLDNLSSAEIIKACKGIYARHGIPQYSFSDCGTQFMAQEFQSFCDKYGIIHETSSPRYPQSNGQAEVAVKVVKNILKKCMDPSLGLLFYRATELPEL